VNAVDVTLLVPTGVVEEEEVGIAGSANETYVEVAAEPGSGVLLGM
jgi:hypothetical protein